MWKESKLFSVRDYVEAALPLKLAFNVNHVYVASGESVLRNATTSFHDFLVSDDPSVIDELRSNYSQHFQFLYDQEETRINGNVVVSVGVGNEY